MYTKTEVNEVLSQVEQEFEKALNSIKKSENTEEEVETEETQAEEVLSKSEDEETVSEEDCETIDDLYSSMTKSEIEDHYNSIKRVLFSESEEAQEEVIAKSEENEEAQEEVESMLKSENDELKSENEELKKSVEEMTSLINRLFESTEKKAPAQKALTSADYIAKSEEVEEEGIDLSSLSKNEITSKLNKLNYAKLSKSDREAINNYCLENGSVEKIKHLITE